MCVSPDTPPTFEKCEAIYTNDKSVGLSLSHLVAAANGPCMGPVLAALCVFVEYKHMQNV